METSERVQQAREFARVAHGDQTYSGKIGDYVTEHLDGVASLVAIYGDEDQVLAYLHDVIEDTARTREDVERAFGEEIARQVQLLTDEGRNRRERKEHAHKRLAAVEEQDFRALRVKAADRLANLRASAKNNASLFKMYRSEYAVFRAAVYREGLAEEMWAEMDALVNNSK